MVLWVLGLFILLSLAKIASQEGAREKIEYSAFLELVDSGNISGSVSIKNGYVFGEKKDGKKFSAYFGDDPKLFEYLKEKRVSFSVAPPPLPVSSILVFLSPFVLIILLWYMLSRQYSSEGSRVMSFARSRPVIPGAKNRVTFADVAGCEEAKQELREIIEFLKDPRRFQRLGGKIPRGVLVIGPPGTGKTLLAKAVAGEAGVPFLSMSGSDFVEMFVGVGAARVRDLFRQAKKLGQAIIFIDEIDAVGRQRFAGLGSGHDEREQTLNQLLVELDGFQTDEAIIVMAATNRPDVLDPALTRPGRFDRTVVVNLPDIREREAILRVHTKNKPLDPAVDLKVIARGTAGLSGADLANIVNEAALRAAGRNQKVIGPEDFEAARDKVLMGVERRSLVISDEERRIIAYHESGHTLVQKMLPEVYPVHKVTIIPRGRALGLTHIMPEKDHFIESDAYYRNTICALLAGRATDKLVFGRMFTGSESDLQVATEVARKMVCEWGMSRKLGPVSFQQSDVFLGRDLVRQREHSEQTSREIDEEVREILEDAERRAREILEAHRDTLEALAAALLERETLSSEEIDAIINRNVSARTHGDPDGQGKNQEGDAPSA